MVLDLMQAEVQETMVVGLGFLAISVQRTKGHLRWPPCTSGTAASSGDCGSGINSPPHQELQETRGAFLAFDSLLYDSPQAELASPGKYGRKPSGYIVVYKIR
jgi:hypothetical protein